MEVNLKLYAVTNVIWGEVAPGYTMAGHDGCPDALVRKNVEHSTFVCLSISELN